MLVVISPLGEFLSLSLTFITLETLTFFELQARYGGDRTSVWVCLMFPCD